MPDYLTKEEIKQWRGSLEKITLEEFARRLGKEISNEKETNDMVDKVYKHSSEVKYVSNENDIAPKKVYKAERISSLAQQSFEREKELSLEKYERELIKTINKPKTAEQKTTKTEKVATKKEVKPAVKEIADIKETKAAKTTKTSKAAKTIKAEKATKETKTTTKKEIKIAADLNENLQISFKKNLTPREQAVFEHFLNNKNSIVYAKELAQVLELPRDYVYKYIKNLRAKMNENVLQNADNGGFILEIK